MKFRRFVLTTLFPVVALFGVGNPLSAKGNTVVVQWNDAALQAIRNTTPGPPVTARALAITHTCMYDAWAAFDNKASGTRFGDILRLPKRQRTQANKNRAISYAAHRCLSDLFPAELARFNALMARLGYKAGDKTTNLATPAGIGNVTAKAVLDFRHYDGANQLGDLNPGAYSDYTHYKPFNTSFALKHPNHWKPLQMGAGPQKFTTPHWGGVLPYALTSGGQFRNQLPKPPDYFKEYNLYRLQAQQILDYSAHLTDEKKVIAEYWADGPKSELPPGHWMLFAAYVSKRDHHTVDQDVRMFFALSNTLFDVSIACWDTKRHFDYVRPITAIRLLYDGITVKSWEGLINGGQWRPYQAKTVVTPPFPEYVSGHSAFSAAAAEILLLFTRNDNFGYSVTVPAGSSKIEPGRVPAKDTALYWATYSDAAAEAGLSRRYGGIHFIKGDLEGRKLGRAIARIAWAKTLKLFN